MYTKILQNGKYYINCYSGKNLSNIKYNIKCKKVKFSIRYYYDG